MVAPLLVMNRKEQIFQIANFRRQAIKEHNLKQCDKGTENFIRERVSKTSDAPPFMCSGCEAFISQNYISRHNQESFQVSNRILSDEKKRQRCSGGD